MKTKRIASGHYSWEYLGFKGTITRLEDESAWYFQLGTNASHDWHSTLKIAKLAVIEYIDYISKENKGVYLFNSDKKKDEN